MNIDLKTNYELTDKQKIVLIYAWAYWVSELIPGY